jgi:hypothetical protein
VPKDVLIKGVDPEVYRRAKAAAALEGIPMGRAVSEALEKWTEDERANEVGREHGRNVDFVRTHWSELERHKGKVVVVSGGKLQGVFGSYDDASMFAARFEIALTFPVDEFPGASEIEIGPDLEIQ